MKKRTEIINYIIKKCKFSSYLEIGIRFPKDNFDLINAEIKHGVDPSAHDNVTYKMTSDEFFKQNDSAVYDLIFIDGLHTEEQTTKDVSNALKHLNDGGVIVMHDCNPPSKHYVRPVEEYNGGGWCGGGYKSYVNARNELYPIYNTCVINEETGIGIITERDFNSNFKNMGINNWDEFNRDRKEILNLITLDEFKEII